MSDSEAVEALEILKTLMRGKYYARCERFVMADPTLQHIFQDLGDAVVSINLGHQHRFWARVQHFTHKFECVVHEQYSNHGPRCHGITLIPEGNEGCDVMWGCGALFLVCVLAAVVSPKWRQSVSSVEHIPEFVVRVFRCHARQTLPYMEDAAGRVTSVNGMALRNHKDDEERIQRRTWFCYALVALYVLCNVTLERMGGEKWVRESVFQLLLNSILVYPVEDVPHGVARMAMKKSLSELCAACPGVMEQAECMYYAFCSIMPNSQRLAVNFTTYFSAHNEFNEVVRVMRQFLLARIERCDLSSFLPASDWFERDGRSSTILFSVAPNKEAWSFCRYKVLPPNAAILRLMEDPRLVCQGMRAHTTLANAAPCNNMVVLHFPPAPSGKTYHFWVSYQAACNECPSLAHFYAPFVTDAPAAHGGGIYVFISMELAYCVRNVITGFVLQRWKRYDKRIAAHPLLLRLWYRPSVMQLTPSPGVAPRIIDNISRFVVISAIINWIVNRAPRTGYIGERHGIQSSGVPPYLSLFSMYDILPAIIRTWCVSDHAATRIFKEEAWRCIVEGADNDNHNPPPPAPLSVFHCSSTDPGVRKTRRCQDYSLNNVREPTLFDVLALFFNFSVKKCMCSQEYFWVRRILEESERGEAYFCVPGFAQKMRARFPQLVAWFTRRRPMLQEKSSFAESFIPISFEREYDDDEQIPWPDFCAEKRDALLMASMYEFLASGLLCRGVSKTCLRRIYPCARICDRPISLNHTLHVKRTHTMSKLLNTSVRLAREYTRTCVKTQRGILKTGHILRRNSNVYHKQWVDCSGYAFKRDACPQLDALVAHNMHSFAPYTPDADKKAETDVFNTFLSSLEWVAMYYHDHMLDTTTRSELLRDQPPPKRKCGAYASTRNFQRIMNESGHTHPCESGITDLLYKNDTLLLAVGYEEQNMLWEGDGMFLCNAENEGARKAMPAPPPFLDFSTDVPPAPPSFTTTWNPHPVSARCAPAPLDDETTLDVKNILAQIYNRRIDLFMDSCVITNIFGFISNSISQ